MSLVIDLEKTSVLGNGQFSNVLYYPNNKNNNYDAIKQPTSPDYQKRMKDEFELIQYIQKDNKKDTNIIKIYNQLIYNINDINYECPCIGMEYCNGGNLKTLIYKDIPNLKKWNYIIKSEDKIYYNIFKQILKGINEIHKKKIIHRDLKLDNILIHKSDRNTPNILEKNKFIIKICDFGESQKDDDKTACSEIRGSLPYLAPEVLKTEEITIKTDIWALGCMFYEILTGEHLIKIKSEKKIETCFEGLVFLNKIYDDKRRWDDEKVFKYIYIDKNKYKFNKLIYNCVNKEQEKRMLSEDLLKILKNKGKNRLGNTFSRMFRCVRNKPTNEGR
tara:strand:+ start:900 stop:1895 length:996 start_codon:yes stop_codon:yes gene_type:complete